MADKVIKVKDAMANLVTTICLQDQQFVIRFDDEPEANELIATGFYQDADKTAVRALESYRVKGYPEEIALCNGESSFFGCCGAMRILDGSCHQFAFMLHHAFGYEVFDIVDGDILVHTFCVASDGERVLLIDIRGITTSPKLFLDAPCFNRASITNYLAVRKNTHGTKLEINGADSEINEDDQEQLNAASLAAAIIKDRPEYYDIGQLHR